MAWTEDQKKAIYHSGHNIIVSAGAGSGKTAVLSERVLEFVKNGYKIDEFLILTFTNLAAGEMKHRIRSKLKDNKLEEANNVDSSDICTFDSFAAALVKKYHFRLGLSPELSNVDSNVISVLKRNIIDEIFDKYYENKDPRFIYMIDNLCFKDDDNLKDLVLKMHSHAELELDKKEYLDTFVQKFYNQEYYNKFVDEIEGVLYEKKRILVNSLYDLPDDPVSQKNPTPYVEKVLNDARILMEARTYNELVSASLNFSIAAKPSGCEDVESISYSRELLKDLVDSIKKLPSTEKELVTFLESQKQIASILIDIVKELDEIQWNYKLEKQVFEFNDIAKFALQLVSEEKENEESVKEELINKYKMIMIDEYQDTSLLQEKFISLIENNNVYMVGDIKQSIYAFRNARSDIFKAKYDDYKVSKIHEAIDMKMNFRSRKEVLDDINLIFSFIMSDPLGGANYIRDHMIDFGNQDYLVGMSKEQDYSSTFITYNIEGNRSEKVEYEIRIIAEDIISKINSKYQIFVPGNKEKGLPPRTRDIQFKDICILMDRGKYFETYKKIFTQYRIPLYVENDENIKNVMIVDILTNILKLIKAIKEEDYSSEDFIISFLSLMRSFIFEKTDEEIYHIVKNKSFLESEVVVKIKDILSKGSQLSNYLLVEKVIDELEIYSKLILIGDVKKNEVYLDEFLKYFKQMSDLDYTIDDFITYLKYIDEYQLKLNLSSTGSDLDSVKIMNIHKSKGLEFPLIYFPYLGVDFNAQDERSKFNISSRFGVILPEDNLKDSINPVKFLENHYHHIEDLSEKIRLLYVSLTRAREKMIFIMGLDTKMKEISKCKNFAEMLFPIMNKFDNYMYQERDFESYNRIYNSINYEKFNVKELTFSHEKEEIKKASKALKIGVNKSALELGTKLHELLEIIDFKSPDFSFISNPYYLKKIKAFLDSDLLSNVKEAEVYKEYEFDSEEYRGIIDLMLIYNDHIDIIDYKTKNIDDEAYIEQLNVYKKFIKTRSDLPINMYLYSIIDSDYKQIK